MGRGQLRRRVDAPSVADGADRYVLPVRGPARFTPLVLSGAAAFVWEELASPLSSAELAGRVAMHFGVSEAEAGPAVTAFLDGLGAVGLLDDASDADGPLEIAPAAPEPEPPAHP